MLNFNFYLQSGQTSQKQHAKLCANIYVLQHTAGWKNFFSDRVVERKKEHQNGFTTQCKVELWGTQMQSDTTDQNFIVHWGITLFRQCPFLKQVAGCWNVLVWAAALLEPCQKVSWSDSPLTLKHSPLTPACGGGNGAVNHRIEWQE